MEQTTNEPNMACVFRYIEELDAFLRSDEYQRLARELGLEEWPPVVWIGRLLLLDNDYGEHRFDRWEVREECREASGVPTLLQLKPNLSILCAKGDYRGPIDWMRVDSKPRRVYALRP